MFGMKLQVLAGAAALAVCLGLGAKAETSDPARPAPPPRPISVAPDRAPALSDAIFARMVAEGRASTLFSPLGADTLLAMIAQSSAEALAADIEDKIGATRQEISNAGAQLGSDALTAISANGLWVAEGMRIDETTAAELRAAFQAETATTDFAAKDAVDAVNAWFAEKTQGQIDEALEELAPNTALVAANALFFQGLWQAPFDPENTEQAAFKTAPEGEPIQAAMMRADGGYAYARRVWGEVVELPFADEAFVYVAALPSGDALVPTPATVSAIISELHQPIGAAGRAVVPGTIRTPRLRLDASVELAPILSDAGLADLFKLGGAFARLARPAPALSAVSQSVRFEMDEEGATAAAATSAVAVRAIALRPFDLRFNRPFFFAIRKRGVASPIVLGYVAEPSGVGARD